MAGNVQRLLDARAETSRSPTQANTAIFYSINNCQQGLAGISFGNFLIKRGRRPARARPAQHQGLRHALAHPRPAPAYRRTAEERGRRAR